MRENKDESQKTNFSDLAVSAFFLLWAVVGWVSIANNSESLTAKGMGIDPGPILLPLIVLTILTIGGLALAVRPCLKLLSANTTLSWKASPNWITIGFLVSVISFPFIMEVIGYIFTTWVFTFAWSFVLAPAVKQKPARSCVVATIAATCATLLIYVGFDLVIHARLQ